MESEVSEFIYEQTYPARVVTVDLWPIVVGTLGLALLIAVAVLLWRGKQRRRLSEK